MLLTKYERLKSKKADSKVSVPNDSTTAMANLGEYKGAMYSRGMVDDASISSRKGSKRSPVLIMVKVIDDIEGDTDSFEQVDVKPAWDESLYSRPSVNLESFSLKNEPTHTIEHETPRPCASISCSLEESFKNTEDDIFQTIAPKPNRVSPILHIDASLNNNSTPWIVTSRQHIVLLEKDPGNSRDFEFSPMEYRETNNKSMTISSRSPFIAVHLPRTVSPSKVTQMKKSTFCAASNLYYPWKHAHPFYSRTKRSASPSSSLEISFPSILSDEYSNEIHPRPQKSHSVEPSPCIPQQRTAIRPTLMV